MRLLYITEDRFPPFRADVVELFAKEMRRKGHTIDWLMQRGVGSVDMASPANWLDNTVFLTGRSSRNGMLGRVLNNLSGLAGDFKIIPLALRHRYDVIQVRDKYATGVIAWFAAKLIKAKFIYWMSFPFAESKIYQAKEGLVRHRTIVFMKGMLMKFILYGIVLKLADHVFVQSVQMEKDVAAEGIPPEKMTPVPMGVKFDRISVVRKDDAINVAEPVLLYLGIIIRLRRPEVLLETLKIVKESYRNAKLVFVGEGQSESDRAFVESEAARLGVADSVEITGFLDMEDAWRLVAKSDVCFSPFFPTPVLRSTSPTKLVEYLALGKCVVANDHPEQCEILSESGVGVCVPWGAESFAREAIKILSNPAEARDKANRGPAWVKNNRTYEVIADNLDACYTRLLSDRG